MCAPCCVSIHRDEIAGQNRANMVSEDREYVERILAGEPEVFDSLVRKYNRMAGAIAYGILGDFHEAEDVVQEAFLKAFRALPSLREAGKFRPWFCGLVRTKAIDILRQRPDRRAGGIASLSGSLLDALPSGSSYRPGAHADDEQLREESRQKVLDAVRELNEEDRLVVVLKHMDGLSYREIAEITGSSISSIESRLFRARQILRKKLDPSKT